MAEFRSAKAKDIPQLRALWQECFGDSDAFCDWFFAERFGPALSTVAEEGGQILSAVHGWPYTLRIRNKAIPSIMMCGVSTHPAARGRGLMRGCISLFMNSARSKGFLALLQKPVDFAIYRWCGHYGAYDAATLTKKEGSLYLSAENTTDALCSDAFAEELLPVYQKSTAGYSCCAIRSARDMALKLRDYAADGARLLRYGQGSTTAYAVYYITDDKLTVPEILGVPKDTLPLLNTLAAMAGSRGLSVKVPPETEFDGFARELRPWGAMTALNLPALMKELCDSARIAAEISDPVIPQNNGTFSFDGAEAPFAHIRLDSGHLMQLLSGYMDINALAAGGHAELLHPDAKLLNELLPAMPCFTVEEY